MKPSILARWGDTSLEGAFVLLGTELSMAFARLACRRMILGALNLPAPPAAPNLASVTMPSAAFTTR
jgi:hypothetical protein